jgi:hypothetical protein
VVAQFRRARKGGFSVTFGQSEARVLRHVLGEMLELLGPEAEPADDPLAAALGIGTATTAPSDPALARLFPDGYTDDPKRTALRTALETVGEAGERQVLTPVQAEAWLRALNDTRLVLGDRLGVTEDLEELVQSLADDDPRLGLLWVYDRLTSLQESLVQALWADVR